MIDLASGNMNVLCAYDNQVLSKQDDSLTNVSPCSHKEADTRVFLHVQMLQVKVSAR